MPNQSTDRRHQKRTSVSSPVIVRPQEGPEISATARDLSSSGIFLYSDSSLSPGSKLELVLMLPPSLGLGSGWALCQASVVRVEKTQDKGMGIAARFDRVEVLPQLT